MSGHSAGENIGGSENLTRTTSEQVPSSRKRQSGLTSESGRVHDESATSGLGESKARKYARTSTCAPSTSNSAGRAPGSSASSATSPASSGGTKKNLELRFLTDYFPEQDVEAGPLTRSRLRTRNADKRSASSTAGPSTSKSLKSGNKRSKRTDPTANTELAAVPAEARSPTPDPSSSNLTVAGSEVSGFSFASSFASELSQSVATSVDTADLRTLGANSPTAANFGLLNAMPTTSRDNDATNPTANANSSFLVRSQHVQRASQFLTGLVPRMQQLLGSSSSVSSATMSSSVGFAPSGSADYLPHMRILSLMEELRSDNEIRQSEACGELSDMLLLGNEESLPNFPIRELILCLVSLLNKDHNFELMLSASRCITNLQEALPRSHSVLVEAVPVLLQKLKRIEYIDVAEQSLVILEVISRRNAKNILAASGVQATISHVDFFSLPTQRLAFQIAANCASFVTSSEFHLAQDCLADLTQRLGMDDKRCVESICSFFNRLIENMRFHPHRLRQIAGKNHELLRVIQQLLSVQPLTISSSTFISLLKSLRYMSTCCGDLSVALFEMGFGGTLRFLLVGSEKKVDQMSVEATNRPAQQLREIVDLIGELLPKLPSTGMFEVNVYLEQYTNPSAFLQNGRQKQSGTMMWVYKDPATSGRLVEWKPFAPNEQLALERNRTMGVTVMSLEVEGQLCEVDFTTMTRRVIATGAEVEIDRRPYSDYGEGQDEREKLRDSSVESFLDFIATVFPLLVEIGSSSTCVNLRYDCVRVMLRMVYAVEAKDKLLSFLHEIPLAAYISSTLSSSKNLALVALAVQLVGALLEKLPDLYVPFFEAEGVFFELKRKAMMTPSKKTPIKLSHSSSPSGSRVKSVEKQRRAPEPIGIADHPGLDAPAAAALNRLLQQQQASAAAIATQSSTPSDGRLLPMPTNSAAASNATNAMRYAAPTPPFPINSRSVLPNLFLSVGGLQGSLYQTLSNAVGANYPHPVYGLNYPGAFSTTIDSNSATFSTPHIAPMNTASISSVKATATERLEKFIQVEAAALSAKCEGGSGASTQSLEDMTLLVDVANLLSEPAVDSGIKPLHDLRDALLTRELSAFQINYSGIIGALIGYLTENGGRLLPGRAERLRRFASVFMLLNDHDRPLGGDETFPSFNRLVSRIVLAVERLEQFSVRITNLSGNLSSLSGASMSSTGGGSGSQNVFGSTTYLRGAQALRFFQSHQIRCNLRRHPSCKFLREWRRGRGSIKVDPFTAISAIERYLMERGIGTTSQEESSENEEVSDEDKDVSGTPATSFKGRIEILIGDNRLPSEMSILQAIRQFSLPQEDDDQETIPPSIWIAGHTLYYRAVVDEENSQAPCSSGLSGSSKMGGTSKPTISTAVDSASVGAESSSSSRKTRSSRSKKTTKEKPVTEKKSKDDRNKDKLLFNEGKLPPKMSLLDDYLRDFLDQTIDDPSERGLVLLRVLYGLNTHWWYLFDEPRSLPSSHKPILSQSCFHSFKLNSKVSRQLSDFLTVATQQIPRWTKSLVRSVPFVFPFSTRRNFLYCTAFGRDRALMHLVNEANPDDHDNESNSRLVPRLERRKISINRTTLLKDAQQAINQLASSRPLLEVGFDGEVGTGFGPTLEFYSTLSRELQKHSIRLWHGSPITHDEEGEVVEYTNGESGLYPAITRHASSSRAFDSRFRRFEFIGRLMAQTLLDSRILDIPLATPFFKWILGQQESLGVADLELLEPSIYNSLREIGKLGAKDYEGLEMYFTFPGNDVFELVKGGKYKALNYNNYRHFVELITHWRLVEGVRADMESVRRGFQMVVNADHLAIFEANEMEGLFCGCSESADDNTWARSVLQQSFRPDHGYTHESIQIGWLLDMLVSFNQDDRRKFLQFVTGSPRLPVGGFRALHPPLTVVRKVATYGCADVELPSAMTCFHYLKLPPYEDYETFFRCFRVALKHIYSFHLN